jgi:hypothetical protein
MDHHDDEQDYAFEPEYRGLSSHLSMTVRALENLGADATRIREFRRAYTPRLSALTFAAPSNSVDVNAVLGQRREFASLLASFQAETRALGRSAVVRKWLPSLVPGVAAAAFHPLIQLYYALDADTDLGVAYSLAYFAWSHLPLGFHDSQGSLELTEVVSRLRGVEKSKVKPGLLYERLLSEAQRSQVGAVLTELAATEDDRELVTLVLSTHWQVNDLLSLHMVTSWHAYRRICELVQADAELSRQHVWQALLVAYMACDAPPIERLPLASGNWDGVIDAALRHSDEHVIKLVWTCRDMHTRWGIDTLALAERAVK